MKTVIVRSSLAFALAACNTLQSVQRARQRHRVRCQVNRRKGLPMKALVPWLSAACLFGPSAAWSADRACMLEGSFTFAGKTTTAKDCMEFTTAVSAEQLKNSCNSFAQVTASMGGKPGKVTFLAQCPRPASGACKNLMGRPLDAYYYNLSAEAIKEKRQGCETSSPAFKGGTWNNGQ